MFLDDIRKSPQARFKKINRHLKENYGITLSAKLDDAQILMAFRQVHEEIEVLKKSGATSLSSPDISKQLLVLEGLKALREDSMKLSPVYKMVLGHLVDYVVKEVTLEASGHDNVHYNTIFDDAIKTAMKTYRSSKYRFPDDIIERELRSTAHTRLDNLCGQEVDEAAWDNVGKRAGGLGGHVPDVRGKENAIKRMGGDLDLELEPQTGGPDTYIRHPKTGKLMVDPFAAKQKELRGTGVMQEDQYDDEDFGDNLPTSGEEPLVRHPRTGKVVRNPFADKERALRSRGVTHPATVKPKLAPGKVVNPRNGEVVADPFRAHLKQLRGAGVMKESENLVKHLRQLLETEVNQAEVMIAAKGFSQDLQEMVEKIGRLQNEDLPPVTDQMRQTYGTDSASAFQAQIYSALQGVMDALYTAKSQVDAAVDSMASTGQVGAHVDMDTDVSDDLEDHDELAAGLDAASQEGEVDDFGGAEHEEPLGRAQKESVDLEKKVLEMKKLVDKAKKLKESRK